MAYAEGYVAAVPLHILKTNRERANTSVGPSEMLMKKRVFTVSFLLI